MYTIYASRIPVYTSDDLEQANAKCDEWIERGWKYLSIARD